MREIQRTSSIRDEGTQSRLFFLCACNVKKNKNRDNCFLSSPVGLGKCATEVNPSKKKGRGNEGERKPSSTERLPGGRLAELSIEKNRAGESGLLLGRYGEHKVQAER